MTRVTLSLLAPPLAVCQFGCATCCAAPIGVFWLAGMAGLIYGGLGGPLRSGTVAWWVVGLGVMLWAVASVWALLTIQRVNDDAHRPGRRRDPLCRILPASGSALDESDPLEEIDRSRRDG
jgi:hypothetical protein